MQYNPGHAHADTLSFELSIHGKRALVNSGISTYEVNKERSWQRGTSAHNTVSIDNKDSSEVWSSFRVARRAKIFDLKVIDKPNQISVSCSHDGYKRLRGSPVHTRLWQLNSNSLKIEDKINGVFSTAKARYYFHPEITIQLDELKKCGKAYISQDLLFKFEIKNGYGYVDESLHYPSFEEKEPNKCLIIECVDKKACLVINWSEL